MWKGILAVILGWVIGLWLYDDFDPKILKGKRVVVTGASTGIGEQIAYHYAQLGANVLITARRESVLQKVVARCSELGSKDGRYEYIPADMGDISAPQRVIQEAEKRLGGIDILVLNHIIILPLGPWLGTQDNFTSMQREFDINFRSYVHLASYATKQLEANKGSVIVVSSLAGKAGVPYSATYSATKFALHGFFSSWRQELRLKNSDISITICIIGLVGTENAKIRLTNLNKGDILKSLKPASPSDTALAIIKGGAKRSREIYFPYMEVKIPTLMRDWLPDVVDYLVRFFYTK